MRCIAVAKSAIGNEKYYFEEMCWISAIMKLYEPSNLYLNSIV